MGEATNNEFRSASEPCPLNKDRYELHLQNHDLLKDVLPIVQTKLLQTLGDPAVNDEILREVARRKLITEAEFERLMPKRYVPEGCHSSVVTPVPSTSPAGSCHSYSEYPASYHEFERSRRRLLSERSYCTTNSCSEKKERCISKRTCIFLALYVIPLVALITILVVAIFSVLNTGHQNHISVLYPSCSALSQSGGGAQAVKSLDEFNDKIQRHDNSSSPLSIDIQIIDPSDWPIGVFIEKPKTQLDISISGKLHANKLAHLLSSVSGVNKLTLNNRCNLLCSESQNVAALRKLKHVELDFHTLGLLDFDETCDRFLEKLAVSLNSDKLKPQSIKLSSVADEGSKDSAFPPKSIKRLEIHNSTIENKIWVNSQFSKVNSILYNSETSLPHRFCNMFPHLQHLSFGEKLISFDNLNNIYDCANLKSLGVHIKLPTGQSEFSVQFLHSNFPKLESANIKIEFSTCATTLDKVIGHKENIILGINELPEILLVNLRISSNCQLKLAKHR